jgi:hypothetical protein
MKNITDAAPMMLRDAIQPGRIYEVVYPFTLDDFSGYGADGPYTTKTWRPGVRFEMVYPDDSEAVADGEGKMLLEVVSTHKPGKWPERVFYWRRWIGPNGKEFGKRKMRIATVQAFRRIASRYQYEYRIGNEVRDVA